MKVKASVKKRSADCKIIRRNGKVYVINKKNPRFKQRQGQTMARIAGVDIPDNKRGVIALTYIYGIGRSTAQSILEEAGIDPNKKAQDWTDAESTAIRTIITESIKRLLDIGCYRGLRHRKGLPVRGQRTKNNSRTRKGKRKTVANKKKATK